MSRVRRIGGAERVADFTARGESQRAFGAHRSMGECKPQ